MRRHHREAFAIARTRPSAMLYPPTFDHACNYVAGYDCACHGGVLLGFDELLARKGAAASTSWRERVLALAFPGTADPRAALAASADAQRHAINVLFDLIDELDEIHTRGNGLRDLMTSGD